MKIGEKPWFVLKDVCAAMRISGHMQVAKSLKENEKIHAKVMTTKGRQNTMCVSEAAVFLVIRRSKKPWAKFFERWLKTEVLPSLCESEADKNLDFFAVIWLKNSAVMSNAESLNSLKSNIHRLTSKI